MFTHLHVHTEYSLLDGLCRIPLLVQRARELGMDSLAITDHGALYGLIDFYTAAREAGVKPILGGEFYVAQNSRHSREASAKTPYHLILLAKDQQGYRNLLQLSTLAHLEGFYYKPRVDREILARHSQGLVALTSCLQGEVPRLLSQGRSEEARQSAQWHREVFGDDFYLELQDHAIPELRQVNGQMVELGRELGLPLVATNDVHYIHQQDSRLHDLLLCIQTNSTVDSTKRHRMADDSFYLKGPAEMAQLFPELPETVENTRRIAEACSVDLEFGQLLLPEARVPPGQSPDDYLAQLAWEGLRRRYPEVTEEMERRLTYELEVIRQTSFAHYFLVVWEVISFTQEQGILYNVRGSAAASLVLYCLGVTLVDPLAYRLVFERFLNVERHEMPDIDLDFQDDRRGEVIAWVAERYGPEQVAQIITFGTLGARAAVRDVGRALGLPYSEVDRVARQIPFGTPSLAAALEANPELRSLSEQDDLIRQLIQNAQALEGIARHSSTHAAGVVISREPLTTSIPLQRPAKEEAAGNAMSQYPMEAIARIGLLKMDFLGLINLTLLRQVRDQVRARAANTQEIITDLDRIPLDDPATFELLSSGETTGVFQLESPGMRRFIKELKPSSLSDLAAMIALYRPGPMQHLPTFIRAKHGQEPVRYPHPALADILGETYGVIVYQDQVLLIAQTFAGYSLGQADVVRKAMGKKIPEIMREERERFVQGAQGQGFSPEVATQVFNLIEPFAGYAFNKAHSVSYALIAYQTAYFKAHYPGEYMTAMLAMYAEREEKVASAVAECHRLGIKVLPPDINASQATFSLEGGAIRFGLANVKNVGAQAVAPIIQAREAGGPFTSVEDLCRRADLRGLNRRAWESLIKVGALGSLGPRGGLLASLDRIISLAQQEQRRQETGQTTMFDLWGETVSVPLPALEIASGELPPEEARSWERELLGVSLSHHPLLPLVSRRGEAVTVVWGEITEEMVGQSVVVAGEVSSVRQLLTSRDQRPFAAVTMTDLSLKELEVTAWPEVYERTSELWQEGAVLLVRGKVRRRQDRLQIACDEVEAYPLTPPEEPPAAEPEAGYPPTLLEASPAEETEAACPQPAGPAPAPRKLHIHLAATDDPSADVARLRQVFALLKGFPGSDPTYLLVSDGNGEVKLEAPPVAYCPELEAGLARVLGEGAFSLTGSAEPTEA